jgi:hypothetical protein
MLCSAAQFSTILSIQRRLYFHPKPTGQKNHTPAVQAPELLFPQAYLFFCPRPKGQNNIIYVVFRGTESTEDLWADLNSKQVEVRPQPRPGDPDPYQEIGARKVFIHAGFRDQFLAVSTALTRNVEVNFHLPSVRVRWTVSI